MAIRNGELLAQRAGDESPLMRAQEVGLAEDDGSSGTLTDSQRRSDLDELEDLDKANQQVGRGRGLLIILSLWGLIFLQGEL